MIDPSIDVEVYDEIAAEHGWRITRVFDTHLHADHLSGARALAARTGAVLQLNPADTFEFAFEPLGDGDRFPLDAEVALSVAALRTPGHTQGSTIYFVGDRVVLTGDTLFVDGVGRPDLAERAEEFAHNLFRSLHERVLTLPDDALILPGHYGETVRVQPDAPVGATLEELRTNASELAFDEDAFVSWAAERTTPRPPNYVEIIKANMGRATSRSRRWNSSKPAPTAARLEQLEESGCRSRRRRHESASAYGGPQDKCRQSNGCSAKGGNAVRSSANLGGNKSTRASRLQTRRRRTDLCVERPDEAQADGYTLGDVERMFMKLAGDRPNCHALG